MRIKSLAVMFLLTIAGSLANACLVFDSVQICPGDTVFATGLSRGGILRAVNPNNNVATVQSINNDQLLQINIANIAFRLPSMGNVKLGETVHHRDLSRGGKVLGFNPFNGLVAVRSNNNDSINLYPSCDLGLTDVCLYFQSKH